jgi:hypothetical protein
MTGEARPAPAPGDFQAFESVQHYAASLDDLSAEEQARRFDLLRQFTEFVDRTPDAMVDELYNKVTHKYRKRGFYTDKIREFSAQVPGTWAEQNFRGNIVRAFFIANGFRIPPEKPPWM